MNIRLWQYLHLVFWTFYLSTQYLHLVFFIFILLRNILILKFIFFIYLYNTLIVDGLTFIHNVNSCFCFLVLNVVAPPPIGIKGVHWLKDGPKFACRVDGCDASCTTKYNLVWHLRAHHNVVMDPCQPGCPSTREEGLRVQDHTAMNLWVLNNPLACFCRNEQKAIAWVRKHALP